MYIIIWSGGLSCCLPLKLRQEKQRFKKNKHFHLMTIQKSIKDVGLTWLKTLFKYGLGKKLRKTIIIKTPKPKD